MVKSKLSPYSGSVATEVAILCIINIVCDQEIAQAMLFAETSF